MTEQLTSKQRCTCEDTCKRKGTAFPESWSWECARLPYLQAWQSADEIERLRAELADVQAAHEPVVSPAQKEADLDYIHRLMTRTTETTEPHSDDLAVDRFAAAMKAKLAKKRGEGRGGWDDPSRCTIGFLENLLVEHVEKGDFTDVGNFAMMIWNRFNHCPESPAETTDGRGPNGKCPICGGADGCKPGCEDGTGGPL